MKSRHDCVGVPATEKSYPAYSVFPRDAGVSVARALKWERGYGLFAYITGNPGEIQEMRGEGGEDG